MPAKPPAVKSASNASISTTETEVAWVLPKKPANPAQSAEAHVLANAPAARLVRVCYIKGPADSVVSARGITSGKTNVTTNIHVGSCVDIGGTDIELTNNNASPVSGTYSLVG